MRHLLAFTMSALVLLSTPGGAQVADSSPRFRIPPPASPKSVTTARVLAIVPSAGHIYAGAAPRGLAFLGGMAGVLVIGAAAVVGECLGSYTSDECGESTIVDVVVPVAFFGLWGWSIYDAGLAARRFNQRQGLGTSMMLVPARLVSRAGDDVTGLRMGVRLALP